MEKIVNELIIEKLYRCIELEDGKLVFDKYDLDNEDMIWLLKRLDEEKFKLIEDCYKKGE